MIARRKRKRKWISGLFILVLIIVAGIVCYLVWENYFKEEKNSKNDEPESVKVEEKIEEESIDGEEEQEIVEKEEVVQYEGEDPNDLEEITGVITYAGASENYLMIRINIDQYLSGGICNLRVSEFGSEI